MNRNSKVVKSTNPVEKELKEVKKILQAMQLKLRVMQIELEKKQDRTISFTINRENIMSRLYEFCQYTKENN